MSSDVAEVDADDFASAIAIRGRRCGGRLVRGLRGLVGDLALADPGLTVGEDLA